MIVRISNTTDARFTGHVIVDDNAQAEDVEAARARWTTVRAMELGVEPPQDGWQTFVSDSLETIKTIEGLDELDEDEEDEETVDDDYLYDDASGPLNDEDDEDEGDSDA